MAKLKKADCSSLCPCDKSCPIGEALAMIGGKWKPQKPPLWQNN